MCLPTLVDHLSQVFEPGLYLAILARNRANCRLLKQWEPRPSINTTLRPLTQSALWTAAKMLRRA